MEIKKIYRSKLSKRTGNSGSSRIQNYSLEGMSLGMCFGLLVGTMFENYIGVAISIGMIVGLVIGMLIPKKVQKVDE